MSIKIGHASIDENGKIAGGKAGDSTGKEVCTRSWYNKGWGVVLRPKSAEVAEKSAQFVEAVCANANVGYDQNQRNTLYKQAQAVGFDGKSINIKCECDCSALMHVAAIAGGANLTYGLNGYTTRTMVSAFVASSDYTKLTDTKHLTSDKYLKRGDILVKEGSHTVMALENGECMVIENYPNPYTEPTRTIKRTIPTMKGEDVKWVQWHLDRLGYDLGKYGIDGSCGNTTVKAIKAFQKDAEITVDGKCGPTTRSYLKR